MTPLEAAAVRYAKAVSESTSTPYGTSMRDEANRERALAQLALERAAMEFKPVEEAA